MRLDGKVNASANVVLEVPQGSVSGPVLFILYTSELFYIVGKHIVGYEDDNTIYAVIRMPPSRLQVMKSLIQYLAGINFY